MSGKRQRTIDNFFNNTDSEKRRRASVENATGTESQHQGQASLPTVSSSTPPVTASSPPAIHSPTSAITYPTPATTSTTPIVASPTPAITSPTPVISTPTPAISTPTPAISTPTPAISTPTPVISSPTPAISTPTPAISTPTPAISTPTPVISSPTPVITAPTPDIISLTPAITSPTPASQINHESVPSTSHASAPGFSLSSNSSSSGAPSMEQLRSDIGLASKYLRNLSNSDKYFLLKHPNKPGSNFIWPHKEKVEKNRTYKKYLKLTHLTGKYQCFDFSSASSGIFCTSCVLFGKTEGGGNRLLKLITEPWDNYAKLTGAGGGLDEHLKKSYHQMSTVKAANFLESEEKSSVLDKLQSEMEKEKMRNKAGLRRVLTAIVHHGRLGLALRGHRDSGELNLPNKNVSTTIDYSQGNFRALIQLMIDCGDEVLSDHITRNPNMNYLSAGSQNNLINCISTVMSRSVAAEVNSSPYFSLMADETTDISGKEQLSVILRFVTNDLTLQERFLCFRHVEDVTGLGLAKTLKDILTSSGVHMENIVGQGYDGAAAMSGAHNGVQKHIREMHDSAVYVHCASHCLNLVLEKACNLPMIQASITNMKATIVFFRDSPKRMQLLYAHEKDVMNSKRKKRPKNICPTRWVESQEATQTFKELYPAIISSLNALSETGNSDVKGKAFSLLQSITSDAFVVAMEVLCLILGVTRPLSVQLQAIGNDLSGAIESIESCQRVVQEYRNDNTFVNLFSKLETELNRDIEKPRVNSRQTQRANAPTTTSMDHYRVNLFLPFVDTIIQQLNTRFTSHHEVIHDLCKFLPSRVIQSDHSINVEEAFREGGSLSMYLDKVPGDASAIQAEYRRWRVYWGGIPSSSHPPDVLSCLKRCENLGTFPNIKTLLQIYLTIPVTTASSERSFSCLKYLKNYLRSTMNESRLNGLAQLYINHCIPIDLDEVIAEFTKSKRMLNL